MERYDVVIVGGGPAGATAGYYCAGGNLRVLIIDKENFPRHKACGGGLLNEKDWSKEFESYASIRDSLEKQTSAEAVVYYNKKLTWAFRSSHLLEQINRFQFDDLLLKETLKKKGTSFRKFFLKEIKKGKLDGEVGYLLSDGKEKIFTRFLVGADGFNSRVSKFLGNHPLNTKNSGTCLEYDLICEKKSLDVRIFFFLRNEIGYGWIFPSFPGYYIGLGVVRKTKCDLKKNLDELLSFAIEKKILPAEYKIKKTFGGIVPLVPAGKYTQEGCLLCGDALRLVNAKTGEGIYYALLSGKIAGQTIKSFFNANDIFFQEKISHVYRNKIAWYRWSVFITPWFPFRWLMALIVKMAFFLADLPVPFHFFERIKHWIFSWTARRLFLSKDSYYFSEKKTSFKRSLEKYQQEKEVFFQ